MLYTWDLILINCRMNKLYVTNSFSPQFFCFLCEVSIPHLLKSFLLTKLYLTRINDPKDPSTLFRESDTSVTKFSPLTTSIKLLDRPKRPDDWNKFIKDYIDVYKRLQYFTNFFWHITLNLQNI